MKVRVTNHNKRIAGARHNDRNFDLSNAPHINPERTKDNATWQFCVKVGRFDDEPSFDKAEHYFYKHNFSKALEAQNERYKASRHPEKCREIDDYRTAKQTCPEETLYYLGNSKEGSVSAQVLMQVYRAYAKWHNKEFPQVVLLDCAFHVDEQTPHIHERKVWIAHDKAGNKIVSQSKALEEMGISLPDPEQPKSRYNNPKMTYTRACREKLTEIARDFGLDIETQPREASKSGLKLAEYQLQQLQDEIKSAETELNALNAELEPLQAEVAKLKGVDKMIHDAYEKNWEREHSLNKGIER